MRVGGQVYYFQQDGTGNVNGLLRTDGFIDRKLSYESFGAVADTSAPLLGFGFKAREHDSQTGLVYMRSRWYDPELARFVSEDLVGLAGGVNQYALAGSDPINGVDPFGLAPCSYGEILSGYGTIYVEGEGAMCYKIGGGQFLPPTQIKGKPDSPGPSEPPFPILPDVPSHGGGGGGAICGYACGKGVAPMPDRVPNDRLTNVMACTAEHYGLYAGVGAAGGGLVYLGWPTVKKRFSTLPAEGMRGASKATSIASSYLSRRFPKELPRAIWAPTFNSWGATTTSVGRALGRWTPVVGWGLAATDLVLIEACASQR